MLPKQIDGDAARGGGATRWCITAYIVWIVTTPYERFPILATVHLERILIGALLVAVLADRRQALAFTGVAGAFLALVAVEYLSYAFSSFHGYHYSTLWLNEYWKEVLLFVLLIKALRSPADVRWMLFSLVAVIVMYQLWSWRDFLNGGSYVYQQGLRRMIGTWSGGGLGAANAWGAAAAYCAVVAAGLWRHEHVVSRKRLLLAMTVVATLTALFSGTRASVVAIFVTFVVVFWKDIRIVKAAAVSAVTIVVIVSLVPPVYVDRVASVFGTTSSVDEREAEDARISAESRIQGLIDGAKLLVVRPIVGFGPGASAGARVIVNPTVHETYGLEGDLQLHNLYGQVMGELGLLGSVAFVVVLLVTWGALTSRLDDLPNQRSADERGCATALRGWFVALLVYGLFSHSLYQHWWVLLVAAASTLAAATRSRALIAGRRSGRRARKYAT